LTAKKILSKPVLAEMLGGKMRYRELIERMDDSEIEKTLKEYFIIAGMYHINDDGTVDITGNAQLRTKPTEFLPIQFNKVTGGFSCYKNELKSFEGTPRYVGGDFSCWGNNFTSLDGIPEYIGESFTCTWEPGLPVLRSLITTGEIRFLLDTNNGPYTKINQILNNAKENNPGKLKGAILDAQQALIRAGFGDNARW
jgi:hypothetical protein